MTGQLDLSGYVKAPNNVVYSPDLQLRTERCWPVLKRHKFFNYLYVVSDDYFMTTAHVDLGQAKASYLNVLNLKTWEVEEIRVEDFLHEYVHIDPAKFTNELYSTCSHPDLTSKIFKHASSSEIEFDVTGEFEGSFRFDLSHNEGLT